MNPSRLACVLTILLSASVIARSNPLPLVSQPLVPKSPNASITDSAPAGTPPLVTLSSSSLTFGPQAIGSTSFSQTVTLSAGGARSIDSIMQVASFARPIIAVVVFRQGAAAKSKSRSHPPFPAFRMGRW